MQNSVIAKIKSAPKNRAKIAFWTAILVAVLTAGIAFLILSQKPTLRVNNHTYALRVADTAQLRSHGLSDTTSLPRNQAMLFVFPKPTKSCFWMKDMNYSLDMIWLDADKRIVHIQPNATPSSYPDTTFCTPTAARYVLEVNAGDTIRAGMSVGQQLKFSY